jgi:hypothetical protein
MSGVSAFRAEAVTPLRRGLTPPRAATRRSGRGREAASAVAYGRYVALGMRRPSQFRDEGVTLSWRGLTPLAEGA